MDVQTDTVDAVTVGQRLRELRVRAGLTQEDVAAKAGVRSQSIYRYEAGEHVPRSEVVMRLAKLFGVHPEYILQGDPPAASRVEGDDVPDAVKQIVASPLWQRLSTQRQQEILAIEWKRFPVNVHTLETIVRDALLEEAGKASSTPLKPPPARTGRVKLVRKARR